MRWHLENWRKLYVGKSPAWLRLSVSARGLGFLLLTYCDDDGLIDIGEEEPGVAIAYLLGARPREHRRIGEDVAELLKDGYLVRCGSALAIRNFAEAQDRTPAAKRTAEWRARKDEANKLKASLRDVTPGVTGDVTCDVRETSPGDALETSPRDGDVIAIRSESDPSPTRHDPPNPQGGDIDRVWSAYVEAHAAALGRRGPPLQLTAARRDLIRRRLRDYSHTELASACRGVFADAWCLERRKVELEWVLRNAGQVEKFAALDPNVPDDTPEPYEPPPPPPNHRLVLVQKTPPDPQSAPAIGTHEATANLFAAIGLGGTP